MFLFKMYIFLLSVLFLCTGFIQAGKVKVEVYYESFCPDSANFITTQLYPIFFDIDEYISLNLIPFGKATVAGSTGSWEFTCQHGPNECYFNKIHSCAITLNSVASSLEFINCEMTASWDSSDTLENCAASSNITWAPIAECLSTKQADELLAENGLKTLQVTPSITWVPTIIFNEVFNSNWHWASQNNFLSVVCEVLDNEPAICKNIK